MRRSAASSLRRLALAATLAAVFAAGAAQAEPVALTFDDVPALTYTNAVPYAETTTHELLAALKRRRVPAIGFVNEVKLEGPDKPARTALLKLWLDAGMDLGNHTYSHASLNQVGAAAYIADIQRGEVETRALLAKRGRKIAWFRPPYLETGSTTEVRSEVGGWLAAHGYRLAPVTLENSDWMFAVVYDDAVLRGDTARAAEVRRAYLDYTAKVVPWYRKAAFGLFGRHPALVMLVHASRLNADCADALLDILRRNELRPVSLSRALRDPAYRTPDPYVGPNGLGWLTRWSLALGRPLPWSDFPQPPAEIQAEDKRLHGG